MAMRAIFRGRLATIVEDHGDGVTLAFDDGRTSRVSFGDKDLVIDPIETQIAAVRAGKPIPRDLDDEHEVWRQAMAALTRVAMDETADPAMRANARKALAEGRAARPKRR